MPAFGFLDAPLPLAFAHRGGASQGIENTMSTFAAAVALGYRYIETDVHATSDGALVAFHDRTLHRVTGVTGRIEELSWRQLRAVPVGTDERVPLLEDLLGTWPDLRVNIDVKARTAVPPLVEVIRRTGALDRVCVGSFSDRRLAQVRARLGPKLCTALAPREALRLRVASLARAAGSGGTPGVPCAQLPYRLGAVPVTDARLLRRAHALGMQVHVWTIDDPVVMGRLLDMGVDGIMTDSPETLRAVLTTRGSWHG
ncbi:MAG: glycerophosphodiester phosphodiesterase [Pseudonocardiales bacterium]